MTLAEFKAQLVTTTYPVAYQAFPETANVQMPFIIFQETRTNNFGADNKVYKKVSHIQVDLFTKTKDTTAEDKVETALADFFWNKVQTYSNDESCYRYTYEVEIM